MTQENEQRIQVEYFGKEFDKSARLAQLIFKVLRSLDVSDLNVTFIIGTIRQFEVTFSSETDKETLVLIHQNLLSIQGLKISDAQDVA